MKLSVVIITKNEEKNIVLCLKSVAWADEVIVLDSGSTDRTVSLCKEYGCKVSIDTNWKGFGKAKQNVVELASHDWILSVDADEVLTDDLQEEIKSLLSNKPSYNAYKIKRNSFYLEKMIKFSGWNRDYPTRLFNKKYAGFNDKTVHESVVVNGKVGYLKSVMEHYTYPTLNDHFIKMHRYAELASVSKYEKGKRSNPISAIIRGDAKFLKMYFLQLGFLDGKMGFLLALHSGWAVYLKYIKLWELGR